MVRASKAGPRRIACTNAPAGTVSRPPRTLTATEPGIPFGTASADGVTSNRCPVTRYSRVVSGSAAREFPAAANNSSQRQAASLWWWSM